MTDTVSASMKIAGAKAAEGFGVILSFEQTAAIYRAMLAASPQGQGSSGDWITHDGGPNPVPQNNCPVCKGLGEFFWDGGLASKSCRRCDGTGVTEGVKP